MSWLSCVRAVIIEVPAYELDTLKEYQKQFLTWLYNRDNDHRYWYYLGGQKQGVQYGSEAFVEWLNINPLSESVEKAKVLETELLFWDDTLPAIFF